MEKPQRRIDEHAGVVSHGPVPTFQRTGHRERLVIGPERGLSGKSVRIPDRDTALALLRDLGRDPWGRTALRHLYAEALGRASVCAESDQAVLEGLSWRLVTGALKAQSVELPPLQVPAGSILPVPEAKPKPVERKPTPVLENPRWSVPRVEVGTSVEAIVTYKGFMAPAEATITIFEMDKGTPKNEIAKVKTTIPAGKGDHKVKWMRKIEEAQGDLEHDASVGDTGPLEYRFKVEAKETACQGESGPLWLTNTVTVKLVKEEDGKKHDKPRVVVLKDALGKELRATSKNGEAKFEKVLVGPIEIRLAEPRFSDLRWSKPRVPVGKPVDAVFKFEDAVKGTKVEVVVHEWNGDGSSTEIKRLKVELKAAKGEAKVSFTRTEDQAQEDVADDEAEGDTGPVEYRFLVMPEEGAESDVSGPLWLTQTVTVGLEDARDGKSLPDGTGLLLLGADGTEHRGKSKSGAVTFDDVVCGPMTIKLAR